MAKPLMGSLSSIFPAVAQIDDNSRIAAINLFISKQFDPLSYKLYSKTANLSTKNAKSVDKPGKTATCPPKHGISVDKHGC